MTFCEHPTVRRDGSHGPALRLGGHFFGLALNTVLIALPLRFVYLIAFRALLDVFVIRIPIRSHYLLFLSELIS